VFQSASQEEEPTMKISARNVLKGTVKKIVQGAVNCEVTIELPGGAEVVSIITRSSVESLELAEGVEAYAIIKASNVMVGVPHTKRD
jgi:molybdopterin-binding protein